MSARQPAFYTTGQVTQMTGLSRPQVLEAVHAGMIRTLPEEKRGGRYVLDVPSVEQFVRTPEEWEELLAPGAGVASRAVAA